jgi:hypothetical protein
MRVFSIKIVYLREFTGLKEARKCQEQNVTTFQDSYGTLLIGVIKRSICLNFLEIGKDGYTGYLKPKKDMVFVS